AQKIDQIAQIRNWFRPKEDSKTYPQIQAYLSGTLDLSTTVSKITTPIDHSLTTATHPDDLESTWLDLWTSILHSSRRTPSAHHSLTTLISALKQHPDPRTNTLSSSAWPKLPFLTPAVREAYNDAPTDDYDPSFSPDEAPETVAPIIALEATAWANLNTLLASLTAAKIRDFATYYAIWAMRAALEIDHGTAFFKYDARVPAAAAWVFEAGGELVGREVDLSPKDPREGNPARGGELWKGVAGFGKERWAFWKERFGVVAGLEGVREETREVARKAVVEMERVE
ncbi:hypothetical protein DM02DRAFT_497707, partial [Periconia macrospinosa]